MNEIETVIEDGKCGTYRYSIKYIKGKDISNSRHGISKWFYDDGSTIIQSYYNGILHGKSIYRGREVYWLYGRESDEKEFRQHELIEQLSGLGEQDG